MGKDREGKFHPAKGKPSGANKEEGTGLRKTFEPDQLDQDQRMTDRYTVGEDELSPDLHVRHPNRNTSKGEAFIPSDAPANKSRADTMSEGFNKTEPEELLGILTRDVFTELATQEGTACVSILLPTHKAGVEVNEQVDLIAFKNALQAVEKQLQEKQMDAALIKNMLEPGYDLLREDKFWRQLTDGLAVFISDNFFKYLRLPGTVSEAIRVNSSFYVSPLIPFMVRKEFFFLLDIAKKHPRFYRADAFGIEPLEIEELPTGVDDVVRFEEKDGQKLFRTGGRGGTGGANFHGIGGGKPDEKQHIAVYLEEVDDTLWKSHLHSSNAPLLLAGQDFLIPIYRSVSDYSNVWPEALTGNHHQLSDDELYQEALKVMQPYFDQNLNRSLEDYGNKSATGLTSSIVADIVPAAYYGRIAQLFVKKESKIFGTFNEQENKLQTLDENADNAEDLVDRAVIKVIQTGGDVFLLEADKMPADSEMAAIFRY